ncbi:MAG TPA: Nif11-like leader peptide family natural product precursor [Nitrospirales bacterium]|nr:Nif11-like leader peptide family natural product precursor [Nitrospirales bacterium]HIA14913.1 Nif11-like leader peptide family natural product precursor [Nitrospirales bacterium]
MSEATLNQFLKHVASDVNLKAALDNDIDAAALIALGAEHGYAFTAEDLEHSTELSDARLDAVAGGGKTLGSHGGKKFWKSGSKWIGKKSDD